MPNLARFEPYELPLVFTLPTTCHLNHASFSSYDGGSTAPLTVREASISSSYSLFAEFFYTRESTSIDVARECCCERGKGDFFLLSPFLGPERSARVLLFDVSPSRTDRTLHVCSRILSVSMFPARVVT